MHLTERLLSQYCHATGKLSEFTGKLASWLVLPIVAMLCWEVLVRSAFNAPTIWVYELSQFLFGALFAVTGAYALKIGAMVNVDVLVNRFKPRVRACVSAAVTLVAFVFLFALIFKGFDMAIISINIRETSQTAWASPLYIHKIIIVLGSSLLGLQAIAGFVRDAVFAVTGRELS
jgi:TRAP-type mannitol/chloroaromatic compound transport system permease small subunit